MTLRSLQKGKRRERECLNMLTELLAEAGLKVELHRNLQQCDKGGADCLDLPGVALEIKAQETLQLPSFWRQARSQAEQVEAIPVLAYRQNRRQWIFMVDEVEGYERHVFLKRTRLDATSKMTPKEFAEYYVSTIYPKLK